MNTLLLLTRFCITAWIGGAILFVILTVQEITSGKFESILLDQLVLIRFPIYYAFTLILLGIGWLALACFCWKVAGNRRMKVGFFLLSLAGLVLIFDYVAVYTPLREMLLPLGSPRPHTFRFYHCTTETLNAIAMLLILIASGCINWPRKAHQEFPAQVTGDS